MAEGYRVTTNLPADLVDEVKFLAAKRRGDNLTQGIKSALSTKVYLDKAVLDGGTILIKKKDGSMIEVHIP